MKETALLTNIRVTVRSMSLLHVINTFYHFQSEGGDLSTSTHLHHHHHHHRSLSYPSPTSSPPPSQTLPPRLSLSSIISALQHERTLRPNLLALDQ